MWSTLGWNVRVSESGGCFHWLAGRTHDGKRGAKASRWGTFTLMEDSETNIYSLRIAAVENVFINCDLRIVCVCVCVYIYVYIV